MSCRVGRLPCGQEAGLAFTSSTLSVTWACVVRGDADGDAIDYAGSVTRSLFRTLSSWTVGRGFGWSARFNYLGTMVLLSLGTLLIPAPALGQQTSDWPTYHHDLSRSGRSTGPTASGSVHPHWISADLDGAVYAEPLSVGGSIVVATENDTIYALDASSGRTEWSTHVGEPVLANVASCSSVRPVVGITSTPVADPDVGLVYAVAFVQPAQHVLVALDLANGSVRFQQPLDPQGVDPLAQLQRAALSLSHGIVYVPFGGNAGDCGEYHGRVMAASGSDGSAARQLPGANAARRRHLGARRRRDR